MKAKPLIGLLGVGAACAACVAIPLAMPLLAGLAASGVAGAIAGWQLGLAVAVLLALSGLVLYIRRRRRACPTSIADQAPCGCATTAEKNPSCGSVR